MVDYKVAVAGLSHDHVWTEMSYWQDQDSATLVAAADSEARLRDRAQTEYQINNVYEDWQVMLTKEQPDALQICASNRESAEIAVAAIDAGIHVILEKPLAATLSQATAIKLAARRSSKTLVVINWPDWSLPHFQLAPSLIRQGAIGSIIGGSSTMGHPGPRQTGCSPYFCKWLLDPAENGGGALMDYGCYGAAALSLLIGPVTDVWATTATLVHHDLQGEDTAQLVLRHGQGLSQISAAWTRTPPTREFVIYGCEGTVWLNRQGGWMQTLDSERLKLPTPPADELAFDSAPGLLLRCLEQGQSVPGIFSLETAWQAQAVIDAASRSAQAGAWVAVTQN